MKYFDKELFVIDLYDGNQLLNWQDFKTKWNIDSEKHDKFGFALGVGYPLKDKPYYWQYSFGDHVHCVPEFPKVDII